MLCPPGLCVSHMTENYDISSMMLTHDQQLCGGAVGSGLVLARTRDVARIRQLDSRYVEDALDGQTIALHL